MTDRKVRYKIITCVIQMNRKGGGDLWQEKESVTKNDIFRSSIFDSSGRGDRTGNGAEAGSESQLFHAADFPYLQKY